MTNRRMKFIVFQYSTYLMKRVLLLVSWWPIISLRVDNVLYLSVLLYILIHESNSDFYLGNSIQTAFPTYKNTIP